MLHRGQWILCQGQGAVSLAAVMLGAATQQGSWLAVLATPTLGIEACRELGVDLRRVIAVDADLTVPMQWAERLVACSDGCDLVVTSDAALECLSEFGGRYRSGLDATGPW
jgi:hypothetical protein